MTSPAAGRRVAVVEVVPALPSRRAAGGWLALWLASYLLLLFASAAGPAGLLVVAAVAVAAVEVLLARTVPLGRWGLGRIGLGDPARALVRGTCLVVFAGRELPTRVLVATAVVVLVVGVLAGLRAGLAQVVEQLRSPPLLSRGLSLDVGGVPAAPASVLLRPGGLAALVELPAAIGLALAGRQHQGPAWAGLGLSAVLAAVPVVLLALGALRLHRSGTRRRVAAAVTRALALHRPEVALYFGGNADWRYQVEMWLEPMELLGRPAIVIVRDREVLAALAPTSLPVLCVPNGSALTGLPLPDLRASLFVANTGDSMHLLRHPTAWTAFIGHGDSDKAASTNPFTRVYDEVWVAGEAGRERYLQADVGVPPDRVVQIGRPRLGPSLRREPPAPGARLTVLYAPTWEGWEQGDPYHTSLGPLGLELVRALLADDTVRVLFRPHPLGGSRSPAVRRATSEVIALLRSAGAVGAEMAPSRQREQRPAGDVLELATGAQPAWSRAAHNEAVARWDARFWAAGGGDAHRVLTGAVPDLLSCFAASDVLVADVSSVTSEWLATDRPYGVLDPRGGSEYDFRAGHPSAAAAVVLGPGLDGLSALLAAARGGPDPHAGARRAARVHLLGPSGPDPVAGLRAAVDRFVATPRGRATSTDGPAR